MLNRIIVKELWGIYTYDIKIDRYIWFITGPNGYGKTTILEMIYLILSGKDGLDTLFLDSKYKCSEIILKFSNETSIIINYSEHKISTAYQDNINETTDGHSKLPDQYQFTIYRSVLVGNEKTKISNRKFTLDQTEKYRVGHEINTESKEFKWFLGVINKILPDNEIKHLKYDTTKIDMNSLSQGNRFIISQLYDALFVYPTASIILVDGPENGLHIAIQSMYLCWIEKIREFNPSLQFIITTHSPSIFRNKWEISSDLYAISHEREQH